MSIVNKRPGARIAFSLLLAAAILTPSISRAQLKQPLLSEDNLKRVSDHVYVIEDGRVTVSGNPTSGSCSKSRCATSGT